jgi:hypothetical protein
MSYHNNSQNEFPHCKAFRSLLHSPLAVVAAKSELFLLLPVGVTVFNILFALQLNHAHSKVDAQPVVNEAYIDRCADNSLGECYLSLDDYRKEDAEKFEPDLVDSEQDPMLKLIPGTDFKAYVRADVATFYGQEPGSMKERKPSFKGQAGKFINMSPDRVWLYWDGPSELLFNPTWVPGSRVVRLVILPTNYYHSSSSGR